MITNIPQLLAHIKQELTQFTDIAVVAMSGGADSTLVACLCQQALGSHHVYSLHLPYGEKDLSKFNANSWAVAEALGVHRQQVSIKPIADAISKAVNLAGGEEESNLSPLNAGNSRARARMSVAYGFASLLAEKHSGRRVRVIGTGNLSEDFIGYDTKGGDALADIFPIGELFKSEVYQLLEHFRDIGLIKEEMIDRTPSAGLWEGQTDESELGYTYSQMETGIRNLLHDPSSEQNQDEVTRFVAERHKAHKHKHLSPAVVASRHCCD